MLLLPHHFHSDRETQNWWTESYIYGHPQAAFRVDSDRLRGALDHSSDRFSPLNPACSQPACRQSVYSILCKLYVHVPTITFCIVVHRRSPPPQPSSPSVIPALAARLLHAAVADAHVRLPAAIGHRHARQRARIAHGQAAGATMVAHPIADLAAGAGRLRAMIGRGGRGQLLGGAERQLAHRTVGRLAVRHPVRRTRRVFDDVWIGTWPSVRNQSIHRLEQVGFYVIHCRQILRNKIWDIKTL